MFRCQNICTKRGNVDASAGDQMAKIRQEGWQENITHCVSREGAEDPLKIILKTGTIERNAEALQVRVAALSRALCSDRVGVQKGKLPFCIQTYELQYHTCNSAAQFH